MRAPGFSRYAARNSEAWSVYNLATASSDAGQMERPCVMPMRLPEDHSRLSGVVYLDYDKKHYPKKVGRKEVIRRLRPLTEWVGRSSGDGALALAWEPSLAGLPLSEAKADYLEAWDRITAYIEEETGLAADRSARSPNRVVFLPRDRIDWVPPAVRVRPGRTPKPLLGRGSSPPSEVDRAVADDPAGAWALLGLEVGVNDCPLEGCAHDTPEGHLNVGGGSKPWMALHYDRGGERGYSYQTLWRVLRDERADTADILSEMPWVCDDQGDFMDYLLRWSAVDLDAPLPDLDMGPLGTDPASAETPGFVSSKHITWLYGHRGTGKTWVALWLAASHVLRNSGTVLWVSAEMSDQRMVQRLRKLGLYPCADRVWSLSPRVLDAMDADDASELAGWLAERRGYVVLDSAGSLRAGTDDDTFQRWVTKHIDPFVLAECGVMVLDHIRKKAQLEDGEIAGPIGTVQKQNRADAMLQLEGRMTATLDVVLRKKRDLLYDDAEEGDTVRSIVPAESDDMLSFEVTMPMRASSGQRLSGREALIVKSLEPGVWMTQAEVSDLIRHTGSDEALRLDLNSLVREGMLEKSSEGTGRKNRFRTRPQGTTLPPKE